jgi:Tol biopolymer transport system component
MKKTTPIIILFLFVIGQFIIGTPYQSGHDLFQQALSKERVDGDLTEAIELYRQILELSSNSKDLASKAQLRIGICYEKLGEKNFELAKEAFTNVVEMYPDQVQEVEIARSALSRLISADTPKEPAGNGPNMRKVASFEELPGFHGSASPNGRYLSYIDWTDGNLALFDTQTREKKQLTTDGTWDADPNRFGDLSIWSPDNNLIAFTWYEGSRAELKLISRDGSGERVIYFEENIEPTPVHWTPDGSSVLVILQTREENRPRKHQDHLAFVNIKNGSVRKIKSFGDLHINSGVNISPDGRYIVYSLEQKKTSGVHDLFMLSTDGTVEYPLVEHVADDSRPFWTPDGKQVLFISDRLGSEGIWSLTFHEGKPSGDPELILTLKNMLPIGMTDKGSLVMEVGRQMSDIFIGDLDSETGELNPGAIKVGKKIEGINSHPVWSVDGRYLAFFAIDEKNPSKLVIHDLKTRTEREVTIRSDKIVTQRFRGWNRSYWTPDGKGISTTGLSDMRNAQSLYRIDTESGVVSAIFSTESGHFISDYQWTKDGSRIYYLKNALSEAYISIISRDVASGNEIELYRSEKPEVVTNFSLSPDGKEIVFRSAGVYDTSTRDVLKLLSTSGGDPWILMDETVTKDYNISKVVGMDWMPDGKSIIFGRWYGYPSDKNQLFRISLDGGKSEAVSEPFPIESIKVSPDGRSIAYLSIHMGSGAGIWILSDIIPE